MLWIEQEVLKTKDAADARLCCYFIRRLDSNWDIAGAIGRCVQQILAVKIRIALLLITEPRLEQEQFVN